MSADPSSQSWRQLRWLMKRREPSRHSRAGSPDRKRNETGGSSPFAPCRFSTTAYRSSSGVSSSRIGSRSGLATPVTGLVHDHRIGEAVSWEACEFGDGIEL